MGKRIQNDPESNKRDLKRASDLFHEARKNGGLEVGLYNYRQGVYYSEIKEDEAALEAHRRALTSGYPLDPVRQRHVRGKLETQEKIDWLSGKKPHGK
jgi:hypothetical protein